MRKGFQYTSAAELEDLHGTSDFNHIPYLAQNGVFQIFKACILTKLCSDPHITWSHAKAASDQGQRMSPDHVSDGTTKSHVLTL